MKNRKALFVYGRPIAPFYSMIMRLREVMYRRRILKVTTLDVPVISVGNLTLGGTGKTPIVQYLARLMQQDGWSPAVISRGYGGTSRKKINVVSSGTEPLLAASCIGDEPRFLAETLPGVPVLTGPVRKFPARHAIEMGSDLLILDDGFQHMALGRTIDLVLFNADTLAGNSRVFPGGDLREPVKALNRCDAFIITGVTDANRERAYQFADLLTVRFPGKPVFQSVYKARSVVEFMGDGNAAALNREQIQSAAFFGFTGIAHPEGFETTLEDLGLRVQSFKAFADHHPYSQGDMFKLCRLAEAAGADALITTEKDMVKLNGMEKSLPLYAVRMEAELDDSFRAFLRERLPEKSEG